MRLHLVSALVAATVLPGAALAQTANTPAAPSQAAAPHTMNNAGAGSMHPGSTDGGAQTSADRLATIQRVQQDLQKAGFQDVKVVAESFVVQAKTKDGNPVVMTMGPHGFSAFEALNATGGTGTMQSASNAGTQALPVSRVMSMKLYNAKGDVLGDVEHVVPNEMGHNSIVLGHGGFLGLGEKQVAIPLDHVAVQGDRLVTHGLTDDQIKAMPAWKRGQLADLNGDQTVQVRTEG